jgi:hypothetical protein
VSSGINSVRSRPATCLSAKRVACFDRIALSDQPETFLCRLIVISH